MIKLQDMIKFCCGTFIIVMAVIGAYSTNSLVNRCLIGFAIGWFLNDISKFLKSAVRGDSPGAGSP